MKIIRLVQTQIKLLMKNKNLIVMLVLMPLVILFLLNVVVGDSDGHKKEVFVYQNNIENEKKIQKVFKEKNIDIKTTNNKKEALKALEEDKVIAVYELPDSFIAGMEEGKLEKMKVYYSYKGQELESLNATVLKNCKDISKKNYLEKKDISSSIFQKQYIKVDLVNKEPKLEQFNLTSIMLIYFMFLSSYEAARYLFTLKKNKVLKRLLVTENSNLAIVSTFALSFFFLQILATMFSMVVFQFVAPMKASAFLYTTLSIILMSFVSVSLSILCIRIIKKEELINMFMTLVTLVLFGIGLVGILGTVFEMHPVLILLSKFSPFYWAYDLVMTGNLLNAVVILLMGGIVLTAGSMNLKEFTD